MNFSSSPSPFLPQRPPPSSPGFSQILGTVILTLAFVLGFPGNLFVVWTVLCRVTRRSVTCLLVLNLAAADALVLLSAPFFMRYVIGGRGWEFGPAFCKLVHYLCSVNMYASIFLIAAMSLDRFLAVSRPFLSQWLRTKRSLLKILLVIWSLAFLFAIPMPFFRREQMPLEEKELNPFSFEQRKIQGAMMEVFKILTLTNTLSTVQKPGPEGTAGNRVDVGQRGDTSSHREWQRYGMGNLVMLLRQNHLDPLRPDLTKVFPKEGLFYCILFHSDPKHMVFQYLMETIFGFLIPFSIIIFCYSQIGSRLQGAKFNKRRRSGRLILLIVAAFAVFWMPYHIVNLIQVSSALAWEESLKEALLNAAKTARPNVTAFAFFSSSINPILYVFAGSSHIRSAGLNFMAKMFEGTHSEGSGSSRVSRSTKISRNDSLDFENLPEMKPLST
ncbi:LT4R1 protein, partial [Polyodon spathula]|nr:LT4R1 protein [Polyodon spathula]